MTFDGIVDRSEMLSKALLLSPSMKSRERERTNYP